jgi:Helix-turn-helix domain
MTMQRRCEAVLGKSPLSYFQDLRVERAQSLLHGSGLDVDAIAAEVGYVDGATLRTLLRERLGRGVRELAQTCADGFAELQLGLACAGCIYGLFPRRPVGVLLIGRTLRSPGARHISPFHARLTTSGMALSHPFEGASRSSAHKHRLQQVFMRAINKIFAVANSSICALK